MPDFTNIDAMQFFDRRPRELALYQDFERRVLAACPDTNIRVQKTQITLENRHGFAFVSLPRRKVQQPTIVVSFGLSYRVDSPRIWVATEPYPNRWTHHMLIADEGQLDDELLGWIKEGDGFGGGKWGQLQSTSRPQRGHCG